MSSHRAGGARKGWGRRNPHSNNKMTKRQHFLRARRELQLAGNHEPDGYDLACRAYGIGLSKLHTIPVDKHGNPL